MKDSRTFCEKNADVVLLNLRKDWGYLAGKEIDALGSVRVWSAVRDVSMRVLACGADDISNSVVDEICRYLSVEYKFAGGRDADFYGRVVRFCVAAYIFLSFIEDERRNPLIRLTNDFFWDCVDCFYRSKKKFLHGSDSWVDLREFVFLGGVSSCLSGDKASSEMMASKIITDLRVGNKDYEFFKAFSDFILEGIGPHEYIDGWRRGVLSGDTNVMPAPYVMLLKLLSANNGNNGTRTD